MKMAALNRSSCLVVQCWFFVLSKVVAHWLVTGVPLLLLMPVAAIVLFADSAGIWALALSLLLASPTLSLLGSISAALTVGFARGEFAGGPCHPAALCTCPDSCDNPGTGGSEWH